MHALVFGYKQTCSEGFYALVDEKPNKLQTDRVAALSGGKIVRVARVGWFWVGWYAGCVRAEGRLLAPPLPDLLPSQEPSLGLSLPSSIWWMWAVSAPPRSGTASANCARRAPSLTSTASLEPRSPSPGNSVVCVWSCHYSRCTSTTRLAALFTRECAPATPRATGVHRLTSCRTLPWRRTLGATRELRPRTRR